MARLALRPSVDARVPLPGVVVAQRILHRPDGSSMHVDRDDSNGTDHADTNCLFVMRSAFYVLPLWGALPPGWEKAGDQVIGPSSCSRPALRCAVTPTAHGTTRYRCHYEAIGEEPPPGLPTEPPDPTCPSCACSRWCPHDRASPALSECSDCLNRGGGDRYDGAGRVHETARQKHNRQQRKFRNVRRTGELSARSAQLRRCSHGSA